MTNAERIRAMADEELADLLAEIAYSGTGLWEWPFERLFCETCPAHEYTLDDGRKLALHECDFEGCECPHGRDIVWWLGQPVREASVPRRCPHDLYCESCGMYNANRDACGNAALRRTK